jgi:hypothetical protein
MKSRIALVSTTILVATIVLVGMGWRFSGGTWARFASGGAVSIAQDDGLQGNSLSAAGPHQSTPTHLGHDDAIGSRASGAKGAGTATTLDDRSLASAPSESSLLEGESGLRQREAMAMLVADKIDPFLRRLERDAGPVASALAFDYRTGVMATLPRDGAQVQQMACGSHVCVLEVWFPNEASRDGWAAGAFGAGGLPEGRVQMEFSMPDGRGWRYRTMFAVDPRLVAIVLPPSSRIGG